MVLKKTLMSLSAMLKSTKGGDHAHHTKHRSHGRRGRSVQKRRKAHPVVCLSDRNNLVHELADLLFHAHVFAVNHGIEWNEILNELSGRHWFPTKQPNHERSKS